jgi:hypothetical protein
MIGRGLRILRDRRAQHLGSIGMMALLMRQDAKPVKTVGMPGLSCQYTPIELAGFRQAALPVALGSGIEQLLDAWGLRLALGMALLAVHRWVSGGSVGMVAPTRGHFNPRDFHW